MKHPFAEKITKGERSCHDSGEHHEAQELKWQIFLHTNIEETKQTPKGQGRYREESAKRTRYTGQICLTVKGCRGMLPFASAAIDDLLQNILAKGRSRENGSLHRCSPRLWRHTTLGVIISCLDVGHAAFLEEARFIALC